MPATFTLRPYQREAVDATVRHFRQTNDPAVIVLPTGAGKSLVIAELARIARQRILVLAHVKELVEQNHQKYEAYDLKAGVFSAGLKQKDTRHQVTFASIQSASRNLAEFARHYSLIIIDECHRLSDDENSQYGQIINHLKQHNPALKVLGLTATPYRLHMGWIYQYHYHGMVRSREPRPFLNCIYELPLRYMIKHGFLTPPKLIDASIAHYDFSSLTPGKSGEFREQDVNALLHKHKRVTRGIIEQVQELAQDRAACMIFAATVKHAQEICSYLPEAQTALITGATDANERDALILAFKHKQLKFLVNVSVLTTGFDAPHVDLIAILRPTQSVSLYQQIVGRGLRLADNKADCLVIDYAGNGFDLYRPEVGSVRKSPDTEVVQVFCPVCEFANLFWGRKDADGQVIEHFGRRCQGFEMDEHGNRQCCDFRFRFKACPHCGEENDIAARACGHCDNAIVDPDDQLKAALQLKNAMVLRCAGVSLSKDASRLRICYHDEQGEELSEFFDLQHSGQRRVFNQLFGRRFAQGQQPQQFTSVEQVLAQQHQCPFPDFVVARKSGKFWRVKERIFDYQGRYRKAHEM